MFTKIKLIFWLLAWLKKLIVEYNDTKLIANVEKRQLESIDNETRKLIEDINITRALIGLDSVRDDDGFKRG